MKKIGMRPLAVETKRNKTSTTTKTIIAKHFSLKQVGVR